MRILTLVFQSIVVVFFKLSSFLSIDSLNGRIFHFLGCFRREAVFCLNGRRFKNNVLIVNSNRPTLRSERDQERNSAVS